MQIEVKTRSVVSKRGVQVVMDVMLVPRGSGNRNAARRLAEALRHHPEFEQDISKVVAGASKVRVYWRPSLDLAKRMYEFQQRAKGAKDVPGQMPLFGGVVPT